MGTGFGISQRLHDFLYQSMTMLTISMDIQDLVRNRARKRLRLIGRIKESSRPLTCLEHRATHGEGMTNYPSTMPPSVNCTTPHRPME